ncbi:MAG: hypothetical protein J0I21_16325 [Alphaproteobacteria bacterium]|nr:hypothetical protein [Alphaproteobacteria bacterium]
MQRRPRFGRQLPFLVASGALVLLFLAIDRLGGANAAAPAGAPDLWAVSAVLDVFTGS